MIGKKHNLNGKIIFACCDCELINTKINHDDAIIEISSDFFGKNKISEKDVLEAIENCDSANIFGKRVCDFLIANNQISKDHIIYVGKIPHTQIYKL